MQCPALKLSINSMTAFTGKSKLVKTRTRTKMRYDGRSKGERGKVVKKSNRDSGHRFADLKKVSVALSRNCHVWFAIQIK